MNEELENLVAKLQAIVDSIFEAARSAKALYWASTTPKVEWRRTWGQFEVAVQVHWEVQSAFTKAFESAGLAPKMDGCGVFAWKADRLAALLPV